MPSERKEGGRAGDAGHRHLPIDGVDRGRLRVAHENWRGLCLDHNVLLAGAELVERAASKYGIL
jgi:hypothetical protein